MTEHYPTAIMPIGKFKGQPVEVLRDDPEYREWLLGQDWFRQKFPQLAQIVVNNLQNRKTRRNTIAFRQEKQLGD